MNKESHKTSRLLLGVAQCKEYTNQHIDSMCHECIKTARLLLGVAEKKEVLKHINKNEQDMKTMQVQVQGVQNTTNKMYK